MTADRGLRRVLVAWVLVPVLLVASCGGGGEEEGYGVEPSIGAVSLAELVVVGRSVGERPQSGKVVGLARFFDVVVDEVLWEDDYFEGIGGIAITWERPAVGDIVIVAVGDDVDWSEDEPMELFLDTSSGVPAAIEDAVGGEYWQLRLSVDAETGLVMDGWGVDGVASRAVLLPGEGDSAREVVVAMAEFTAELRARLPRNRKGGLEDAPGPRYSAWVEYFEGPQADPVDEWLALDPGLRQIPDSLDELDDGVVDRLRVHWHPTTLLLRWGKDESGKWVGIVFESVGVVGPWYLDPADAAVIVDAVLPGGRNGTVYVWPADITDLGREALLDERVQRAAVAELPATDTAGWMVLDLGTAEGDRIQPISQIDFQALVDTVNFRR